MRRGSERRTWGERLDAAVARLPRPGEQSGARPRWNPGRPGAIAMAVVAVVSVAIAVVWILGSRPHKLVAQAGGLPSVSAPIAAGGSLASPLARARTTAPAVAGSPSAAVRIVVDVVGKVTRAGVYRLPAGSRVVDAVTAAGGVRPGTDLTSVNLARVLVDGEQIAIGVDGATQAATPSGAAGAGAGPGSGTTGGPVDLNTATVGQLDALPGVGPVLAQHIVDWRTAHGRFDSVQQLNDVSGIGDAKFADLSPLVTAS